ncbi:GlxA family transcriptional regulator, partial [Pseudomonas aeruginosa]|nr:GlxA family transcriptional regulator [Pseudomonas aeruginosa]
LTQAAAEYGITPVEMARASIVGQPVHLLSPLVPSTYLLVGLAERIQVTRRQLERLFRVHLDDTPSNFYLGLRLDKARQLLRQ